MRNSNHSPLDSTGSIGSATESTSSESNHAISNVDSHKGSKDEDLEGASSSLLNDRSTEEVTKAIGAIDASSTNEDEDSGNFTFL